MATPPFSILASAHPATVRFASDTVLAATSGSGLVSGLASILDSLVPSEYNVLVATAVVFAVIAIATSVASSLVTRLIRRIVGRVDDSAPVAIFVNIGRVAVWCLGASVVLSECFGIDPAGIVTALGVGGIALSLGLQDTIKNLIGGLQLSTMRLLSRGDHVRIGSTEGVVGDITWRHTTVLGFSGETIVIPNSVLNSTSLTILPPIRKLKVPFLVPYETLSLYRARGLDAAQVAELAAARATERLRAPAPAGLGLALQGDAQALVRETTDYSLSATIVVWVAEGEAGADAEGFDKLLAESAVAAAVADICAEGHAAPAGAGGTAGTGETAGAGGTA